MLCLVSRDQYVLSAGYLDAAILPASTTAAGPRRCASQWQWPSFVQPTQRVVSVGGRLIGWYLTFGHHDWMAIGEFPDEKAAASAILAAAGGGSLSDIETTVAMSAQDAHATFQAAAKAAKDFRSAGRS